MVTPEGGLQGVDRDLAVVLQVLGKIDVRHAARAKFFLDGIAVGERDFESVNQIWHCVLALLGTVLEYGLGRQAARRRGYRPSAS